MRRLDASEESAVSHLVLQSDHDAERRFNVEPSCSCIDGQPLWLDVVVPASWNEVDVRGRGGIGCRRMLEVHVPPRVWRFKSFRPHHVSGYFHFLLKFECLPRLQRVAVRRSDHEADCFAVSNAPHVFFTRWIDHADVVLPVN